MTSTGCADPCFKCLSFLAPRQKPQSNNAEKNPSATSTCCPICLGLWDNKEIFRSRLERAICKACEPYYGGNNNNNHNRFSSHKDPPVISLPGDVVYRYYTASKLPQYQRTALPLHQYLQSLKQYANEQLKSCLEHIETQPSAPTQSSSSIDGRADTVEFPSFVIQEEQGFLAVQIVLTTPPLIPRPPSIQQALSKQQDANHKRKGRKQRMSFETQGGHPRTNLERTLHLQNKNNVACLWTTSQAMEMAEQDKRQQQQQQQQQQRRGISRGASGMEELEDWFVMGQSTTSKTDEDSSSHEKKSKEKILIRSVPFNANDNDNNNDHAIQIHVALWRRAFLVQGNYTKTRRDVSQTPFFVNDNPKKRQRLGRTSIEELILPPLVEICGGISTCNESPNDGDKVVFGKAKFHASGREDMDVRMILPITHINNNLVNKNISGRPFCCEVIDALRMPTLKDLKQLVYTINHATDDVNPTLLPESKQYYGQSPLGVGVDPTTLSFAKADVFKNLQSETEHKHKFYGCLCWSQEVLPPLQELIQLLTTTNDGSGASLFPLELKQQTPIRVLHRRANAVRIRHVLSCHHVERLDDHYFRLHISTDAGTYVKEFCHGDLGRTQPNVSTLLGYGKIDILELDCEGIQIN